jgi:tetratricopeptide (TPR) repeat protein
MDKRDSNLVSIFEDIDNLKKRVKYVRRKLRQEKSESTRKDIIHSLSDLNNQLAWSFLDAGEFEKGLSIYQSLSWRTHGEDKYNGISRALIEMEYYDDARQILERGINRFPQSHCLLVGMGLLHRRLGHDFDALRYFKQALKCSPGDRHALYDKAITLSELGYYEDSLSIVNKLIKKYPDDPEYLIETGYCTLMMGYPENAIEYYKKASDTGFASPSIYGGLFCAYVEMGLKKEALEMAQKGIKKFPDVPAMYENLGEAYFEYGWIDDAKKVLQEGLRKFPDDERLKEVLKKIDDDTDDPDKNRKPPLVGIMLLLSLILKKLGKKN